MWRPGSDSNDRKQSAISSHTSDDKQYVSMVFLRVSLPENMLNNKQQGRSFIVLRKLDLLVWQRTQQ